MAHVQINGTTFDGTPSGGTASAWQPTKYTQTVNKIGTTLVAANGTRNRVSRATKYVYTLTWDKCNNATRSTLRTIQELTSTFSFTTINGASVTVQTEDSMDEDFAFLDGAGNTYWNITLRLYQV